MKELNISWNTEDLTAAFDITEAQAEKVLDYLDTNHDPEYGINWDVAKAAIQTLGFFTDKNDFVFDDEKEC